MRRGYGPIGYVLLALWVALLAAIPFFADN